MLHFRFSHTFGAEELRNITRKPRRTVKEQRAEGTDTRVAPDFPPRGPNERLHRIRSRGGRSRLARGHQLEHRHGPDIAPDASGAERAGYGEVVLEQRLRDALVRLNPNLPAEAIEDAFRKLTRPEGRRSRPATALFTGWS